jgi:hypothetical protein
LRGKVPLYGVKAEEVEKAKKGSEPQFFFNVTTAGRVYQVLLWGNLTGCFLLSSCFTFNLIFISVSSSYRRGKEGVGQGHPTTGPTFLVKN